MNAVKREARSLMLPASVGLLIGSIMVLIYLNSKMGSVDQALFWFFGAWIDEAEFFPALLFLIPPIIQLSLLGAEIPHEIDYAAMVLTRSGSRIKWFLFKLTFVWFRSLIMSLSMMLPVLLFAVVKGASSGECLAETVLSLMMTWALCQGMFVLWSNALGLWFKPNICIVTLMLLYAFGLPLFLGRIPGWRLWPSVQGMLYAHDFVFGISDSGWFTPLLSAAYCAVSSAAAALIGGYHIRSMDLI